ncbi:MAG: lysylphosphatidylglycerol synthase transmembrane domain-containing protein [Aggregatilineales bacterium]
MFARGWHIGLIGVAISAAAVIAILSQVDLRLLGDALAQARYVYLIPTFLLLFAGQVTRAARWQALLNGGLRLGRAFRILNVSYLVNGVLPLRLGEVARVYLATRAEPPVRLFTSASTVIVERLLDLLAVLILLGMALAISPTLPAEYRTAGLASALTLSAGFAVLVALANQRNLAHQLLSLVEPAVPAALRRRAAGWLDSFLDGLLPLARLDMLLTVLFWTGVSWGLSAGAGYVLMFAFFDQASWAATFLYIAAAAFAIAVPAVPGNIGTYEWAVMLALSALGYGEPTNPVLVSFAVVVHGINLALYAVFGGLGIVQEGMTLGQLAQEAQRMNRIEAASQDHLEYVE